MNPPEALPFFADQDSLEPLALLVGVDLARNTNVVHRRHEDEEASWQGNVAGDTCTLAGNRLFGDLDQDFLPLLEQLADDRQIRGLHAGAAATLAATRRATSPASAATEAAIGATSLRSGGFSRGGGFLRAFVGKDDGFVLVSLLRILKILFFRFGEACFQVVGRFFLGSLSRCAVAEALIDVILAHRVAEGGGLVEGFFLHLLVQVLLGLAGNRFEIVFVLVDGLFFEDPHAGRVSEELADNFALRRDGLTRRSGRRFGNRGERLGDPGHLRLTGREGRWCFDLLFDDFRFVFLYGSETKFAARRLDAMRGGSVFRLVLMDLFDRLDPQILGRCLFLRSERRPDGRGFESLDSCGVQRLWLLNRREAGCDAGLVDRRLCRNWLAVFLSGPAFR